MKLKIDENLPAEVAQVLDQPGHDVCTVLEEDLGGQADTAVIERCRVDGRCLISLDTDFANIRAYPPREFPGLAVLRPTQQSVAAFVRLARRFARLLQTEHPTGRLWIVEEGRVRIRGD